MTETRISTEELLRRSKAGDAAALGKLFAHYRDLLRKMVRLRLDRVDFSTTGPGGPAEMDASPQPSTRTSPSLRWPGIASERSRMKTAEGAKLCVLTRWTYENG
jgi:hypothetical protein